MAVSVGRAQEMIMYSIVQVSSMASKSFQGWPYIGQAKSYSALIQVLNVLPTPQMFRELYLSELSKAQDTLAVTLATVGEHDARKGVLLRMLEVHKRRFGDSLATQPAYMRG
jgi:hypothetical protein